MAKLTRREREVVILLTEGKRQTEIAKLLCITPRTVYQHVTNARLKTASSSTFDLAVKAIIEKNSQY